ncbi:putative membrane protein [Nautilia profundicola AmH]|uniref:Membrane protein n=1 Tax=Nautilia profundicola (strain ATCC BAA-1463 / DSM 18972 / AmH) TaxID=598659 RepID=B9L883_NAUPA|nr:hypothetical protein [Nautilia profundicola]ACM92344.1 putative membrane protein [Nautilia profundicola AmH]
MEFLYSIIESFKDLTKKEISRLSLINGIFWAVVWMVLGMFLWDYMINFTNFMINLLPFKFVQNAGAEFIFMILWLQAVLISIGVFFTLFNNFLSKKIFSIVVAFLFAIFWLVIFMYYKEEILGYLEKLIKIFPFESIEEAVSTVLAVFIFYSFYIVSMYLSFLLLSEKVILKLIEEEYPFIEISSNFSKIKILYILLRDFVLFLIALVILYPLLFVPFLNIFIIVGLWAFIIKNALFETVFSIIGEKITINNKFIWGFSIISVFLNFIPLVNLFAPALGLLSVYHYIMEKKIDLLEKE